MNALENHVAIVTGGAMGIGGATSRSLADSGAKVLIADIAIESAETNARAIRERGGTVLVVEADVSKALSIKNMIDHAIEEWGRLDILVNNAYNAPFGGNQNVVDTTEEQWDAGMALLVKAIFLGAKYAPFVVPDDPNSSNFRIRDVALPKGLTSGRFQNRTDLRKLVDKMKRIDDKAAGDPVKNLDTYYNQGYDLITSKEAQKAFDISAESDAVRNSYGRNSFGQRALLSRRLIEAGVPFVTLYEGGWDHHVDIYPKLNTRLPNWDITVSTLMRDLETRGLLEKTLVVMLGEFGRTPKVNKRGGRDHWSNAMSVMMAGGGTPGGQIIGATDRKGYSAVDRVCSPENFVSTIYRKLGIDPDKMYYTPQGRPTHLVSDPKPITELM